MPICQQIGHLEHFCVHAYGAVKNFHTLWLQTPEICFTMEGRSWRLACAWAVFSVKGEGQSPSLTLSTSLCSLEILGISVCQLFP